MSAKNPDVLRYFSYLMILVYTVLGGYIIFNPAVFFFLSGWQRIVTGVICVSYGVYRFARIKNKYTDED